MKCPFDEAAHARAKRIATAAGKPKTRIEGLRAIHAVLQRNHFGSERAAYEAFGVSQQRFYEWKKVGVEHFDRQPQLDSWIQPQSQLLEAMDVEPSAAAAATPLLVSRDWIREHTPNLIVDGDPGADVNYGFWPDSPRCTGPGGGPGVVVVFDPEQEPHGLQTRTFSVTGIHPTYGKWCHWHRDVHYESAPVGGESADAAKQRADRHREREKCVLRKLDYCVAASRQLGSLEDTALRRHQLENQQHMAERREQSTGGQGSEHESDMAPLAREIDDGWLDCGESGWEGIPEHERCGAEQSPEHKPPSLQPGDSHNPSQLGGGSVDELPRQISPSFVQQQWTFSVGDSTLSNAPQPPSPFRAQRARTKTRHWGWRRYARCTQRALSSRHHIAAKPQAQRPAAAPTKSGDPLNELTELVGKVALGAALLWTVASVLILQ